ncbi:MAG: hypothetical protein UU10_C0053G0001, partial [Parcubacteria group bacterium GW2011_GWF1_40_6]
LEPETLYSRVIFIGRILPCSPKSVSFRFSLRTAPAGIVPKDSRKRSVSKDKSEAEPFGYSTTRSTRSKGELFLLVMPMISGSSSPPAVKLLPMMDISILSLETVLLPAKKTYAAYPRVKTKKLIEKIKNFLNKEVFIKNFSVASGPVFSLVFQESSTSFLFK